MPAAERDHYRVLCVAPDASSEEIEQSFRQLARRLHPDVNGGDGAAEERMKELNVARAALTEPTARAKYDERLRRERRASGQPQPPAAPPPAPMPAGPPQPWATAAAKPPARGKPLVSWMRARAAPPPPSATPEIDRFASAGRLVWIGLVAALGFAVVIFLVWLRRTLDSGIAS